MSRALAFALNSIMGGHREKGSDQSSTIKIKINIRRGNVEVESPIESLDAVLGKLELFIPRLRDSLGGSVEVQPQHQIEKQPRDIESPQYQ